MRSNARLVTPFAERRRTAPPGPISRMSAAANISQPASWKPPAVRLAAWIADPQTLKPGNNMPMVPLNAEELRSISAYLAGLK